MREKLIENLNPRTLLSWPVFLISLIWAVSTNLLDNIHNPIGHNPERFVAVFSGHLVLFSFLYFVIQLIEKLPRFLQSVLMIPTVAVLAALRGLVVWQVMMAFGFDTEELFGYRVFGAITNVGFPMVLTAIAVQRIRTFSRTRSQLEHEKTRLLDLRDSGSQRIQQESNERLQEIRQTILTALESNLGTSFGNVASAISQTLEQIVRPLSHQLESERTAHAQTIIEYDAKVDWPLAVRQAFTPKFLRPTAVSLVFTTVSVIFSFNSFDPLAALGLLLIVGLGSLLLVTGLKHSLARLEVVTGQNLVALLTLLGLIASGFVLGFATLIVTQDLDNPLVLVPLPAYLLTAISLLLAFASSTQGQARAALEQLNEITVELAWEVARINEEERQRKKAMVGLLHGRFQSAFMSSILRLRAIEEGKGSAQGPTAEQILLELRELVTTIGVEEKSRTKGIRDIFQDLETTWGGIATVSFRAPSGSNELELDSQLLETLSDLIPELTFNSIKHGNATRLDFTMQFENNETLSVKCQDNGNRPSASGKVGLGTQLLDQCALQWARLSDESGTATTLLLPFKGPEG